MNINGVNIPNSLLDVLRDGRLVIFAGAGVSAGTPAKLPHFAALARQISEGTGQVINESETEDLFLGRLEGAGTDVHLRAADILQIPGAEPTELHNDLLRLSATPEDVRIVTTNFDLMFERAAEKLFGAPPEMFRAPALPYGQRFQGIVHIHGAVSKPHEIVLTNRDFGRAYLTESDGWARRFLVDMFASHTVLFIGYSHNDTIMTYLTPSLPRDGADRRYALIGSQSDEPGRWRKLGIKPIIFPQEDVNDYSSLYLAVSGLANYIRRGILDWQQQITRIASGPPPLEKESTGVIEYALTDPVNTRFFVEAAESPEWIAWLDNRNYLDALFSHGDLDRQHMMLSTWLRRFAVEEPGALFSVIERHGSKLNPHLWNMIAWQMGHAAEPLPDQQILSRWVHFLMSVIPPDFNDALLKGIAENCANHGLMINLLQIYNTMTESRRQTDPRFARNNSDLYYYQIRTLWEQCLKPNVPEIAEPLLERTVQRLEERHSLILAWEGEHTLDSGTFSRSAIEPHEQDRYSKGTDALIDIARDCLEWLASNQPDTVKLWCERYSRSQAPLLRRLAVHILSARTDLSADDKLTWLLEHYDVNELPAKHEIFRVVACIYPESSLEQRKNVLASVRSFRWPREDDPERSLLTAHHNFDWLQWLNRAAPDCELTKAALDNIESKYPQFLPSEHPDFNIFWSNFTQVHGEPSRWSVQEMLEMSPGAWLPLALEEQPQEHPYEPRDQIIDNVKEATKRDPGWGLDLATEMIQLNEWDTHVWRGVIQGLQDTELDGDRLAKAVHVISKPELDGKHDYDVAYALSKLIATNRSVTNSATLQLANRSARRFWRCVPFDDRMPGSDWLTKAINHQGGYLAEFWIQSIATWREHQEPAPAILSSEYREVLSEIMVNQELPGKLARVILCSHISFLTHTDEEWARWNLIPLLDHDHDEFESSWEGIIRFPNVTPAAAELLKEPFLQAVEHINDRMTPETRSRFISRYTSMLTWFVAGPTDRWITKLLSSGNLEVGRQFARHIGHQLQFLDESTQKEWWSTWLKEYWGNRLIGIPTSLDAEEIETMMGWTTSLTALYPEAVELAVNMPTVPMERGMLFDRLADSDIPGRFPESVAKLLIRLGEAEDPYYMWHGAKSIIDQLLQTSSEEETKRGLEEIIVKFAL